MKTLSVIVNARVESSRMEKKIIRPFSDTTLLDIVLSKLEQISQYSVYIAAIEDEILDIAKKYNVHIINRSKKSVEKGWKPHNVTFAHYMLLPTSHIMMINPCLPFLSLGTVVSAANYFMSTNLRSMTSVKAISNVLFDSDFNLLTSNIIVSTQHQKPIYEMAHAFHIFDKQFFMENEKFWDYTVGHPGHYLMDSSECFDIDTPLDFTVCELLYKEFGRNHER